MTNQCHMLALGEPGKALLPHLHRGIEMGLSFKHKALFPYNGILRASERAEFYAIKGRSAVTFFHLTVICYANEHFQLERHMQLRGPNA